METFEALFCGQRQNGSIIAELIKEESLDQSRFFEILIKTLLLNPFFSGGILISIVGFFWYSIQWAIDLGKAMFRQNYQQSLEITNENMAFSWVMEHINKKSKVKTQHFSMETNYDYDEEEIDFKFFPGFGSHYFYYKDRWITVDRCKEEKKSHDDYSQKTETVTLSTWGANPNYWKEFLIECSAEPVQAMKKGLQVHFVQDGSYWNSWDKPKRRRTMDSVILSSGLSEKLCKDVQTFLESADWYHERGVPYRRGYLLYGPPGTGKTSVISALASQFGYSVAILSLNDRLLTDSNVNQLINRAPNKTIILLEDIDVAFVSREEKEDSKKETCVTLSGLLNAIDGVASAEERIIFMTTNYKERLDSALIRPGRIDFQAYLGHCTEDMIERMFRRFYNDVSDEMAKNFVEATKKLEKTVSPAELQRHLIYYKLDPQEAIDNVHSL
uniref:Mitochondrial chaperone BCS1 n=1 Tax=Acrobeloides nanus TaxID=290746 RepID=A0A914DC66_9BILA